MVYRQFRLFDTQLKETKKRYKTNIEKKRNEDVLPSLANSNLHSLSMSCNSIRELFEEHNYFDCVTLITNSKLL